MYFQVNREIAHLISGSKIRAGKLHMRENISHFTVYVRKEHKHHTSTIKDNSKSPFSQHPRGAGAKKYKARRIRYTTTRAVPVKKTKTYELFIIILCNTAA